MANGLCARNTMCDGPASALHLFSSLTMSLSFCLFLEHYLEITCLAQCPQHTAKQTSQILQMIPLVQALLYLYLLGLFSPIHYAMTLVCEHLQLDKVILGLIITQEPHQLLMLLVL